MTKSQLQVTGAAVPKSRTPPPVGGTTVEYLSYEQTGERSLPVRDCEAGP
jgi:hypothetical protein